MGKLFRKHYGDYKYSTIHRGKTKLSRRQEVFFHAHQECDMCKKGLPHTHVYEHGKVRFYFPRGSKKLKAKTEGYVR